MNRICNKFRSAKYMILWELLSNQNVSIKVLVNENTLLPMMFLGLCKLRNICCGHKMFLNKIRDIFCVPGTKFVSATNVARAGKRGNICVGNNVSSFARAFEFWKVKETFRKKPLKSAFWRANHVGIQSRKVQIRNLQLDTHVISRRLCNQSACGERNTIENFVLDAITNISIQCSHHSSSR